MVFLGANAMPANAPAHHWQARAPPALKLEEVETSGRCSIDERDFDTPREAGPASAERLPVSPSQRKTKSRAARAIGRNSSFTSRNSLKDSKVLMVTDMKRSDSLLHPDLFRYHNHFEFLGVVGRTHLSEVFRVQHRQTGELYAVKRSRRRFKSKIHRERCLREISAVAALPSHPNIVGQYRAWQEGGHFYIQMDLCEGGSLHQMIQAGAAEDSLLSDEELWTVTWEVASGLEFLHHHGVLHLDIKPENIYRDASGVCQIGDFGLAVSAESKEWWEEGDGDYVAPELLKMNGEPSPAADIFSLGSTLYECATGEKLMRTLPNGCAPSDATLPGRPPALQSLLQWMLHPNPAQRPTAGEVLQYIQQQGAVLLTADSPGSADPCCLQQGCEEAESSANTPTAACSPPPSARMFAEANATLASPFASPASLDEQGETAGEQQVVTTPQPGSLEACRSEEELAERAVPMPAEPGPPHQHQPFTFSRLTPHMVARKSYGRTMWHRGEALPAEGVAGSGDSAVAATPLARPPTRRSGRAGSMSAAVARRAAAAAGGLQRWVPSLSPLLSEGALTPGALSKLSPFSSVKGKASSLKVEVAPMHSRGSTPGSGRHTHSTPGSPMLSPAAGSHRAQRSTDSRDGWRLSRRDMVSPDSDVMARSVSESDLFSFSCGTGGSVSSLDFMDTGCPSQPNSPEFQSAAPAEPQATPELFSRTQLPQQRLHAQQEHCEPPPTAAPPAAVLRPAPAPSSLTWDLHTSPEFLMQLPPGSPASPSSGTEDMLPSRSISSIRRFPTLDSMESMQLDTSCQSLAAAVAKGRPGPLAKPMRLSPFSAPNRLTSTFCPEGLGPSDPPAVPEDAAPGAAHVPSGPARKRPLSRHNSRRGLLGVLSGADSVVSCGSLDQTELAQRLRMDSSYAGAKAPWGMWEGEKEQAGASPIPLGGSIPPWARGTSSVQPSPLRGRITGMTLSDGSGGVAR